MGKARRREKIRYTQAQIAFVAKNIPGRSYADMLRLFNKRFDLSISFSQMKCLLRYHNLTNGFGHGNPTIPRERKYLDVHLNYLRKNVPGTMYKIVLEKFNQRFGFSISIKALKTLCKKYEIHNGFTGYFPKGHVPFNKGKKGICAKGSEKGWFRPGHPGYKRKEKPIGSKRVTVDGYVEVKISDKPVTSDYWTSQAAIERQKRWRMKHVLIWEKAHGPVPKGHVVIFLDGDRQNFKLSNLQLVSRAELAVMNHKSFFSKDRDITKAGYAMAAIKVAVSRRKQDTFTGVKKRKMIFMNNSERKIFVSHGSIRGKTRYYPVRENENGTYHRLRSRKLKTRATFEDAQRDLYKYALEQKWRVL